MAYLSTMSRSLSSCAVSPICPPFSTRPRRMPRPKSSIRLVLAQARLFPDMFPLTRQVQIACDTAKGAAARLAGIEISEARGQRDHPAGAQAAHRQDPGLHQERESEPARGRRERAPSRSRARTARLSFTGLSYLNHFVLPNFYFHESIAYAILRHNGVEVGKMRLSGRDVRKRAAWRRRQQRRRQGAARPASRCA